MRTHREDIYVQAKERCLRMKPQRMNEQDRMKDYFHSIIL